VLHAGFVDDRVCTPCDCGADGEVICAAQFFQDAACAFELEDRPDSANGDACTWEEAGLGSVRIVDDSTCAPTGGEPLGEAVVTDPVTVCCSE
jgi:hypothetical protein